MPGRLLVVDWVPSRPDGRPPLANFLFDGGQVTEQYLEDNVHLATNELAELAEWRLADASEQDKLLLPLLARRLHACAKALAEGTTVYLYDGHAPANPSADAAQRAQEE